MFNTSITMRDLKEGMTYYCGYCAIEEAARWLPVIGHNSGVYGWNSTIYACGALALVTGYRPQGWRRLSREECERLNGAARNGERIPGAAEMADVLGMTPQALAVIAELRKIHQERNALE